MGTNEGQLGLFLHKMKTSCNCSFTIVKDLTWIIYKKRYKPATLSSYETGSYSIHHITPPAIISPNYIILLPL